MLHQVKVMGDQHDAIARCHTGHCDKPNQRRNRDVVQFEIGESEAADESEGNIEEDLRGKQWRAEIPVEKKGDDHEDDRAEQSDPPGRFLLRTELAFETDEISLRQLHLFTYLLLQP